MKALTIALSVIAALLIALIAVFLLGGALGVEASVTTTPAAQDAPGFAAAVEGVEAGSAPLVLETPDAENAGAYALTDVTVTFANSGLFNAEWLTFEIVPSVGDVAVCSQSASVLDVPARSQAQLTLRLLSKSGASGAGRALEVEYYVLGMRRTMTVPLDG